MQRTFVTLALSLLAVVACVNCGDDSSGNQVDPLLSSVTVNGSDTVAAGATTQLTATASYTDGTSSNVTNISTWSSSNLAVATVSPQGLVSGVTPGSVTVTAKYQNLSGTRTVTSTSSVVAQFTVTPDAGTSAGPGQCQVSQDGTHTRNQLLCTFDARASSPNLAATYHWEIPSGSVNVFSGSVLTRPLVPCGTFAGLSNLVVRITVNAPEGTDSRTQIVNLFKVGEC